jgi:hypothetical protein
VVFACRKGFLGVVPHCSEIYNKQAKIIEKTGSGKVTIATLFPADRLPYAFFGIVNQSTGLLPGKLKML